MLIVGYVTYPGYDERQSIIKVIYYYLLNTTYVRFDD